MSEFQHHPQPGAIGHLAICERLEAILTELRQQREAAARNWEAANEKAEQQWQAAADHAREMRELTRAGLSPDNT